MTAPAAASRGKLWAFNRRSVVDQIVYVRAETLDEAWVKARTDDVEDATDMAVGKTTLRRTPNDDDYG